MSIFELERGQRFETAEDIRPKLGDLKSGVTRIELGGNSYGVGACEELAAKLAKVDTLQVANLDDMFTGRLREEIPCSLEALLTALLDCPHLHTVNLSDNAFGIATIDPLEKFLANHIPLEHLYLSNNGFGPEAGARVGAALEKLAVRKRESGHTAALKTVICGRNRLEDGSMKAWARFIKEHGTITEIRLYQNGIRQSGIEHLLTEGLAHAPLLEKLDLQDNTFTERGSKALAAVIDRWPAVRELGVSDCLLSAKGSCALLAKMLELKSLSNLETLRLQYNEIDERGLSYLAKAVTDKLVGLKLLELNGNRFSEDHGDVATIVAAFEKRGYGELDDLDDMEEVSDDEDEAEELGEAEARDAEYAEDENVAEDQDSAVDRIAEKLRATGI